MGAGPFGVTKPPGTGCSKFGDGILYRDMYIPSLKLTANATENGWLEYYIPFLLGQKAYFQGQTCC